MGYNDFIKYMFRMGFTEELTAEEQKQKELNEYIANI